MADTMGSVFKTLFVIHGNIALHLTSVKLSGRPSGIRMDLPDGLNLPDEIFFHLLADFKKCFNETKKLYVNN